MKEVVIKSIQIALSTIAFAVLGATATVATASEVTSAPEIENFVATKSRAEVRAGAMDAARHGQIARNDMDVERIASQGFQALKTRVQVVAETREAARLGLIHGNNQELSAPVATPEQLRQIAEAGQRAQGTTLAAR